MAARCPRAEATVSGDAGIAWRPCSAHQWVKITTLPRRSFYGRASLPHASPARPPQPGPALV
jgi:hypothetical protein